MPHDPNDPHNQCDAACMKLIINGGLVAPIARRLNTPEARDLAAAATAYRDALSWLGITITRGDLVDFEGTGCEQAQKLYAWSKGEGQPDTELMRQWAAEFDAAYRELIHGNLP